jgi:hypothetical protein
MLKKSSIIVLLIVTITLIGGVSVVGLLQSTERVSTSGIIVQPPPPPSPPLPPPSPPPGPPPPEPTVEIEVYYDVECTEKAANIEWGSIEVGQSVVRTLFIRNEGDTSVVLGLQHQNWNPSAAVDYITLTWNYNGSPLTVNSIVEVLLTLYVDPSITDVDNFSFDVVLVGEPL